MEDARMLGQDVLLEDLRCVAIELKHGGIKLQNILGADLGRARCLRAHDWPEIGRQLGGWSGPTAFDIY